MVKVGIGGSNVNPLAYADQRRANVPIVPFKRRPTISDRKFALGTQAILQDATDPAQEGEIYQFSKVDSNGEAVWIQINLIGSGDGDVMGPGTSTDNALARFDSITGKIIQNSLATLNDGGILSGLTQLNVDNITIFDNSITSSDVNGNMFIAPNGTGDLHLQTDQCFQDFNVSAGTVLGRVYNTNQDLGLASSAEFRVMTRPEPDGEARFISTIAADRGYAFGVDDVDSQVFKITTDASGNQTLGGSTEIFRITPTGERTMPLQPCFACSLSADDLNVTGNGASYTLGTVTPFNELLDQGNHFSGTAFTAPVAGNYYFSGRVKFSDVLNATRLQISIVSNLLSFGDDLQLTAPYTHNTYVGSISAIIPMLALDQAFLVITVNGLGGNTADIMASGNQTTFSGNLIC